MRKIKKGDRLRVVSNDGFFQAGDIVHAVDDEQHGMCVVHTDTKKGTVRITSLSHDYLIPFDLTRVLAGDPVITMDGRRV